MDRVAVVGVLGLLTAGCATAPPIAPELTAGAGVYTDVVEVGEVPFFPQRAHHCGPAALATVLGWSGVQVEPATLAPAVYLPGRKGSLQAELLVASRRFGRVAYVIDPELEALIAELDSGHPVLVLQNLGLKWLPRWHYAVVVGYDLNAGTLVLRSGDQERRTTAIGVFEHTWRRADNWGIVVLSPTVLPARADALRWLQAAAGLEHARQWRAAEGAYATAIERWPESPAARLGLGNARYGAGDLDGAEAAYRAVLAKDATHAPAWNNLAQVLLERGRVTEAEAAARRAVSLGGPLVEQYRETLNAVLSASKQTGD